MRSHSLVFFAALFGAAACGGKVVFVAAGAGGAGGAGGAAGSTTGAGGCSTCAALLPLVSKAEFGSLTPACAGNSKTLLEAAMGCACQTCAPSCSYECAGKTNPNPPADCIPCLTASNQAPGCAAQLAACAADM